MITPAHRRRIEQAVDRMEQTTNRMLREWRADVDRLYRIDALCVEAESAQDDPGGWFARIRAVVQEAEHPPQPQGDDQ